MTTLSCQDLTSMQPIHTAKLTPKIFGFKLLGVASSYDFFLLFEHVLASSYNFLGIFIERVSKTPLYKLLRLTLGFMSSYHPVPMIVIVNAINSDKIIYPSGTITILPICSKLTSICSITLIHTKPTINWNFCEEKVFQSIYLEE